MCPPIDPLGHLKEINEILHRLRIKIRVAEVMQNHHVSYRRSQVDPYEDDAFVAGPNSWSVHSLFRRDHPDPEWALARYLGLGRSCVLYEDDRVVALNADRGGSNPSPTTSSWRNG